MISFQIIIQCSYNYVSSDVVTEYGVIIMFEITKLIASCAVNGTTIKRTYLTLTVCK